MIELLKCDAGNAPCGRAGATGVLIRADALQFCFDVKKPVHLFDHQ